MAGRLAAWLSQCLVAGCHVLVPLQSTVALGTVSIVPPQPYRRCTLQYGCNLVPFGDEQKQVFVFPTVRGLQVRRVGVVRVCLSLPACLCVAVGAFAQ
jgi:hypothetical protein